MIRLWTLGSLDLRGADGREIRPILSQPKRLALLAYLALPGSRAFHRRDELLALFWPERDHEHARAALSRAIYYLRNALGNGVIVNRGDDEIAIVNGSLWCDAAAFKDAIAAEDNARALELYRGNFLPGFFVSEVPGVEEWLETARSELRSHAARAAWALAEAEDDVGHAKQAVGLAPYDEAGIRRYLTLLDRKGDRAGAVVAYEDFSRRIATDLDLSPAPETAALVEVIRARTQAFTASTNENGASPVENGGPPPATSSAPLTIAAPRKTTRTLVTIAAGIALIATASAVLLPHERTPERGRVVVASFANRTGDSTLDPLGTLAADLITQSLVQTGLVPKVAQPVAAKAHDAAEIERLGKRAGAATIVAGSFYREGNALRFNAHIVDLLRDNVVWAVQPIVAPIDSARYAIERVTERATGAVAALMDRRFESWFPIATAPPTFAAFQEFVRGLDFQLRGYPITALDHYRRAVALDTSFTWARMQMAVAHMNRYENAAVDSIAEIVSRGRDRLTPLQRHWLDWMHALRTEDRFGAYRAMRQAAALAPARFQYSLALQADAINRPRETLEALDKLGAKSPYNGGSSNYWFLVTKSLHQLGLHVRELEAARQARIDNPEEVDPLGYEIRAFAALGQVDSARARLQNIPAYSQNDARNVALWEQKGITLVLIDAAEELREHGHAEVGRQAIEQVIAWHRSRPPKEAATRERRGEFGRALYVAHRWDEAEAIFASLRKESPTDVPNIGFLGAIAARRGDRARAEQTLALLERMKQTALRRNEQTSYWQAIITGLLGDREAAVRHLGDLFGPPGRFMHPAYNFESLKGYAPFEELVKPKG